MAKPWPSSARAVIEAKIALSSQPVTTLEVELPGGQHYQRAITREQFEQLIQPIIERTVGPCRQALKDAGLKPEQIDEVVLVGRLHANSQSARVSRRHVPAYAAHRLESG